TALAVVRGGGFTPVRMDVPADTTLDLVWPPAPETPRIRFLRDISAPSDLGVSTSIFRRVTGILFGGSREDRIQQPYGIAVDSLQRIYVADQSSATIRVFNPLTGEHKTYGGTNRSDFEMPVGVAVDRAGRIFVSDSRAAVVIGMEPDGDEFLRISAELLRPAGIALHPADGLLYVVDVQRHEVLAFDMSGNLDHAFGGRGTDPGKFNFPTNIAINRDGTIYITDALNFRIQAFDAAGTPLSRFGQVGDSYGQFARPKGVGVDSEGHIYVVEGLYDAVNVFDSDGQLLLTFGRPGSDFGEFWLATGLFVDSFDRVYVADSYNGRIQVFQYLAEDG
ncbi:MAG: 6-bladed beta-propeller, partial [Gemmatimonadales bacterium]